MGKRSQRQSQSSSSGSGLDLARLALRGVVGGTMIAHGVKHGRSLPGTAGWFGSIGFKEPELQAKASAAVEIASGAALVAGAATPLAASGVVGTLGVAFRTVHIKNGFWITSEGWEYVTNLSLAAVVLAILGGGKFSVDRKLGLEPTLSGRKAGLLALGLGVGGAAGHLKMFWEDPAKK